MQLHRRKPAKNSFIRASHSSDRIPRTVVLRGCSPSPRTVVYPRLGSSAPHTIRPTWLHAMAPAHITQGSTVTYSVHSRRYFPPSVEEAAVNACISACAVASCNVSTRLCPRPTMRPPATTTAPIGTSCRSNACRASFIAMRMNFSSAPRCSCSVICPSSSNGPAIGRCRPECRNPASGCRHAYRDPASGPQPGTLKFPHPACREIGTIPVYRPSPRFFPNCCRFSYLISYFCDSLPQK